MVKISNMSFQRKPMGFGTKKKQNPNDIIVSLKLCLAVTFVCLLALSLASDALKRPISLGNTDPITYHLDAIRVINGIHIGTYMSPGYAIAFLAPAYSLFGPGEAVGKLLNVGMLLATFVIFYFIIKELFSEKVQHASWIFVIMLLFALFNSEINFYYSTTYKEAAVVLLGSLLMLLFIKNLNSETMKYWIGAAISVVTAISTQLNGWFVFIFAFYMLTEVYVSFSTKRGIVKTATFIVFSIVVLVVALMPWAIYYSQVNGGVLEFMPSNAKKLIYLANAPSGCQGVKYSNFDNGVCTTIDIPVIEWAKSKGIDFSALTDSQKDDMKFNYIIGYLASHPSTFLDRLVEFVPLWFMPSIDESQRSLSTTTSLGQGLIDFGYVVLILEVIGLIFLIKDKVYSIKWSFLLALFLILSATYMMTTYLMRYKMYFQFFDMMLASYGVFALLLLVKFPFQKLDISTRLSRQAIAVIALFLLAIFVIYNYQLFEMRQMLSPSLYFKSIKPTLGGPLFLDNFTSDVPVMFGINISSTCVNKRLSLVPATYGNTFFVRSFGEILDGGDDIKRLVMSQTPGLGLSDLEVRMPSLANGPMTVEVHAKGKVYTLNLYRYNGKFLTNNVDGFLLEDC